MELNTSFIGGTKMKKMPNGQEFISKKELAERLNVESVEIGSYGIFVTKKKGD